MSQTDPELQWVEQLAHTMAEHQLYKLELETEDISVTMRARIRPPAPVSPPPVEPASEEVLEADVTLILSKDVGLFRMSDTLKSGAEITKGQKIGSVEAISVEHELISEYTGTLVEMLVRDGDPVEYGQPLLVLSERDE